MQWLDNLNQWFDSLTPWFALTAGGLGVLAWAVGLKSVLSILEKIIDVVAPLARLVVDGVTGATRWFVYNVIGPGVRDIVDSWPTIATVLTAGWLLWGYMDYKVDRAVDQLEMCQSARTKLERDMKSLGKQPAVETPWFDPFRLW